MTLPSPTLLSLADDLASGRTTSQALVEACLAAIQDAAGEGSRTFISVDKEGARLAAQAMDSLRKANAAPSRFAGIPISIKDLFDIQGQQTRAGSVVLDGTPPATADAVTVARLRRMGFVLIGRTNMTEFAYSGIGINPHYGTPKNRWRRDEGRVPGGSSSGAAISVTDGMAYAALGTDTGGSCRIPAAFNGLVGYKPTAARVPLDGAVPLSSSLDSIGPIARTVSCCALLDSILAGDVATELKPRSLSGLRLAVPTTVVLDKLDDTVATTFERALSLLSQAGAKVDNIAFPEFAEIATINAKGGFTAAESYAWHRQLLEKARGRYDPRVSVRIQRGSEQSAADYLDAVAARASLINSAAARLSAYDALIMPTVAVVPPRISDLESDEAFGPANLLVLRNPTTINMIDGCAISVPAHRPGEAPVGLMIAAAAGADRRVFEIAAGIESLFAGIDVRHS